MDDVRREFAQLLMCAPDRSQEWMDAADALVRPPTWHRDAACCDHPCPQWWFPERGDDVESAKAVCSGCPVREVCLDASIHELSGVWGGTSARERR
jgi:hypothetical protein